MEISHNGENKIEGVKDFNNVPETSYPAMTHAFHEQEVSRVCR